jgi:hypothetical protein
MQYINCFDVIIGCEQNVMRIPNILSLVMPKSDNKNGMQGSQYINFQKNKSSWMEESTTRKKKFLSDYALLIQVLYF